MKSREEKVKEYASILSRAASLMKLVVGIGNNAAWMACLDAFDQIKKHPRIRTSVRGGHTPYSEFKRCFGMFHDYERRLLFDDEIRFFHVADMAPKTRAMFGDITDREYYDFWCSFGFQAYMATKPFYTSLVNKFRLAYIAHGTKEPEIMGWATAANAALDMAVKIYDVAIDDCVKEFGLVPQKIYRQFFKNFNIKHIADFWAGAVKDLDPAADFEVTETERKNISQGCDQLMNLWIDEDTVYKSRVKTVEDFAEVFRTDGMAKKATRQFAEFRDSVKENK